MKLSLTAVLARTGIALAALAIAGSAGASASDLPARPYTKAFTAAQPFDWTGFYVGGQLGGASMSSRFKDDNGVFSNQGLNPGREAGFTGGGYGGYNWQVGSFVFGVDAHWSYYRLEVESYPFGEEEKSALAVKLRDAGSVKARFGMAFGDTLVYAAAGPAWADMVFSAYKTTVGGGAVAGPEAVTIPPTSTSRIVAGFAAAAGIEHMITPDWILRTQFQYAEFGTQHFQPVAAASLGQKTSFFEGTIGLAYKFGPGLVPPPR